MIIDGGLPRVLQYGHMQQRALIINLITLRFAEEIVSGGFQIES